MSSRQLRKIARRNGAKAAGAKTPEGIKKSSMNAQRHGLTGKALVLTNESQAQYDALENEYTQRFQPADGVEMDLIDDMVSARWRLRRIWIMQTAALDLKMDLQEAEIAEKFTDIDQPTRAAVAFSGLANSEKTLQLLLRYETTYNRMYNRAMKVLHELQKDRIKESESATCEELRNDPKETVSPSTDRRQTPAPTPVRPDLRIANVSEQSRTPQSATPTNPDRDAITPDRDLRSQ